MKKIAWFLTFIMVLCMFPIKASAQDVIPVSAEITQTTEELKITVYLENVKNLVSFRGVVEYDTSAYILKSARASTYIDSYGNETENLSGMWVFGNLYDGTGSVGAFVSVDGATKTLRTPVCEFLLEGKNGVVNKEDIVFCVMELVTDDANGKNDVKTRTPLAFSTPQVDVSGLFGYEKQGETVNVTEIKTQDEVVFVPRYIDGFTVRGIVGQKVFNNACIVFDRNVLRVSDGAFSKRNMIIAPYESAPVAAVKKAGGTYLAYYENVKPHSSERVLYTNEFLLDDFGKIFNTNCVFKAVPSHVADKNYFGTGSVITLENGGKSTDFQLCVKGDVNGDSVCDALDILYGERYVNGLGDLYEIQQKSADMNEDNNINPQDYTQLVNLALGLECSLFEGVRGDLNGDNCVDILDMIIFDKLRNDVNLSEENKAEIDFNNNGAIDDNDKFILSEIIMMFE